jgi:anti-anti-sigma regulatory factor
MAQNAEPATTTDSSRKPLGTVVCTDNVYIVRIEREKLVSDLDQSEFKTLLTEVKARVMERAKAYHPALVIIDFSRIQEVSAPILNGLSHIQKSFSRQAEWRLVSPRETQPKEELKDLLEHTRLTRSFKINETMQEALGKDILYGASRR